MSISFDKRTGRYRGSDGKFIKQEKVFELLERYRIQKQNLILDELETLNNDKNYDKFLINTAKELKHLHTINYIVGKGGVNQLNDTDVSNLNKVLKNELLLNFDSRSGSPYGLEELVNQREQEVISQGEFVSRIKAYTRGARKSFWKASEERDNSPYMRRFLHGTDNCQSCIEYASVGMVAKGSLPNPGEACECRSNCNCTVTYYSTRQYKEYLRSQLASFSESVTSST